MDLTELVKELEKEYKVPVEIDVNLLGEKGLEGIKYGSIKDRRCFLIPSTDGNDAKIKSDIEKLEGGYDNFDTLLLKLRNLSKLDGGVIGNNSLEGKLREEASELATKRTFLGSKLLYNLFKGRYGNVFHDINKEREILKKKFREHEIEFLNNHYTLTLTTLYLGSSDCHGMISGIPIAKIEYDLLK